MPVQRDQLTTCSPGQPSLSTSLFFRGTRALMNPAELNLRCSCYDLVCAQRCFRLLFLQTQENEATYHDNNVQIDHTQLNSKIKVVLSEYITPTVIHSTVKKLSNLCFLGIPAELIGDKHNHFCLGTVFLFSLQM